MPESVISSPPPANLKILQEWFGSIIQRPLTANEAINPLSPSGNPITKEAPIYISPSPTLSPHQRIQIYNQQYWWRLLSTLQINFPLLTRLFGCYGFNQSIAIPYLNQCPPDHWSIFSTGERLPAWLEKNYLEKDQPLVLNAARLDFAFGSSFIANAYPPLNFEALMTGDTDDLLEAPFCLQPHLFLLDFPYDLPDFREKMLKEAEDYWTDHPFPELIQNGPTYFALYRNHNNNISWQPVDPLEFRLLERFKEKSSIQGVCSWIEMQDATTQQKMTASLQAWIQDWTRRGWLTLSPPENDKA